MKRREEVAIMLSALSAAGITENEYVRCAVACGLKMIRVKKFAERQTETAGRKKTFGISRLGGHPAQEGNKDLSLVKETQTEKEDV